MLLDLRLPNIVPGMSTALIEVVYAKAGAALKPGERILDLTIDLGATFAQDCPPVTHYRLVAGESARVVEIHAAAGDVVALDGLLARLATGPAGEADIAAARPPRMTIVGILRHAAMASTKAFE